MLARLFRSGLILFAVFALVWTATILWWQSIHRMPTTTDIVTHLFLLPAGMIAGYLVIRRALDGIRRNVAAAVSTPAAAQDGVAPPDGAVPDDDPSRRWRALVLGAALRTAKGGDTAATAAATAEQQRPDVVDVLRDGMPIFAAPAEDIDVEGTREALEQAFAELPWNDEAVRTVALASDVAERLVAQVLEQYPGLYFPGGDETTAAAPQAEEPPRLVLTLLLPERWQAPMAAAAGQYVRGRLTGLWPIERISMETLTAKGDGDAMVQVDRAILALHREPTHELRGVIAADSHIGAEAIDRLRATNRLFSAQCEHGVAPSEAAAGVLLYPPQGPLAAMLAQDAPPASIVRATLTRLDAPTPDKGQPRTAALDQAIAQTLGLLTQPAEGSNAKARSEEPEASAAEPAPAPQPVVVTADISPHPVRTVELARVFSERFGELDVSADLLPVGTACGYTGNAGALLAIVLAHQQCAERGGPALAVTAADPQQRGAIAVVPPATA